MDKKVKIKNYFILAVGIVITCVGSLYIFSWCKQYNDSKLNNPVIGTILPEVKYDNLDSLLRERDFLIVYMCTSSETICRNFEVKFKKYIQEKNLNNDIIYFNLGDHKEENDIISKIYNKYKHKDLIKKINNYPSVLIFSQGKIIDLISPNKTNSISISLVKEFLEGYNL